MTTTTRIIAAGALAASFALAAAPASAQQRNCIDTLATMREFSQFLNAVTRTSAANTLRTANQITIFAPTNQALARLDRNLVDRLFPMDDGARQPDPVLAPAAIAAHVVTGTRNAAALAGGGPLTSVAGTPLSFMADGPTMTVRGVEGTQARVSQADIACTNGVIHAIDGVLIR